MFRTAKPAKTLVISEPKNEEGVTCNLLSNIILVSKYTFDGEGKNELSVKKGDILKLLDRPGNGWVLVKFIDKMIPPGLVPASYVDIAINDSTNPITLNWLYENNNSIELTDFDHTNYLELQIKNLMKLNAPITINNRPYPVSALISNVLSYKERYWYRVDVSLSNQTKVYLCRYYQDFYNLHLSLLETLSKLKDKGTDLRLPKLPEPIPSNKPDSLNTILSRRCYDLNVYINNLISSEHYQYSKILIDWLEPDYKDLPGFRINKSDDINLKNEEISDRVLPGSEGIEEETETDPEVLKDDSADLSEDIFERGAEEDDEDDDDDTDKSQINKDLPQRSKSKNIYNHYQQINNFGSFKKLAKQPTLKRKLPSSLNLSPRMSSPVRQDQTPAIPTPIASMASFPLKHQARYTSGSSTNSATLKRNPLMGETYTYQGMKSPHCSSGDEFSLSKNNSFRSMNLVECKIASMPNKEIITVSLNKAHITSAEVFKRLLATKVLFDKLYVRLPHQKNFEDIDHFTSDLVEFLRYNNKILLKTS
ncbi:uncharacterized protein PRCAT00000686001 [Priceomyces carsonii]|uniref:uncharacterized protein n=1 Tax=Priceomyces carsonii TaxID=28549 RepID=UPI002EDA76DF|nr:unnamed protein product [Priceomyces carsonii]